MQDKRKKPRRSIELTVKIVTAREIFAPSDLKLYDISETGARIKSRTLASVPDEFCLVLRTDLSRWCRVVWRDKDEAGVRFIAAPG